MKQLLVLSGKGGTGKTTVSSAIIRLSEARAFADCDVDAPNLHLLLAGENEPEREDFEGMPKAVIDPAKCLGCGACQTYCHFDAIKRQEGGYQVEPFACEGCALCSVMCPAEAITMQAATAGDMMLYRAENRIFSTAQLRMGAVLPENWSLRSNSACRSRARGDDAGCHRRFAWHRLSGHCLH